MSFPDSLSLSPVTNSSEQLARLVYELLDAHWDTERLMREPPNEIRWRAHLSYLKDLQHDTVEALGHPVTLQPQEVAP